MRMTPRDSKSCDVRPPGPEAQPSVQSEAAMDPRGRDDQDLPQAVEGRLLSVNEHEPAVAWLKPVQQGGTARRQKMKD
jgi:hypothetical protein